MCLRLPGHTSYDFWTGSVAPVLLVAVSVWLNLRPTASRRISAAYHAAALVLQVGLLSGTPVYDWGAGPIAAILLLSGLWRTRPEPLENTDLPGLTRVPG